MKRVYRPKRKNKAELFKALFHYWSVKLLDRTYRITKDNRTNAHVFVDYDYETGRIVVKYHSRNIAQWSFALMVEGVFHEIGHIMQGKAPYETDKQIIYSEYDAEKYALKMMKRYYTKKDYQEVVEYSKRKLNDTKWQKDFPLHHKAFSKIRDYK